MNCPNCEAPLEDDVLEDIEIRKDGIHIQADEIFRCTACDYFEYNRNDEEEVSK